MWRPDSDYTPEYDDSLAQYPSGIYALAVPEKLSIRTWDIENDLNNSYMTNGSLFCIPQQVVNGWQCVNPRRDYHNDVRLPMTETNVVEIRVAYSNFTQGIAKICAMPEYFPGEVKNEYNGNAFFVDIRRSGASVELAAFRHYSTAEDGRTNIATTVLSTYENGKDVVLQIGVTNLQVYYGTTKLIDAPHGLPNALNVYSNGVFPHYEFQNTPSTTTATVQMNGMKCRRLLGFEVPSE